MDGPEIAEQIKREIFYTKTSSELKISYLKVHRTWNENDPRRISKGKLTEWRSRRVPHGGLPEQQSVSPALCMHSQRWQSPSFNTWEQRTVLHVFIAFHLVRWSIILISQLSPGDESENQNIHILHLVKTNLFPFYESRWCNGCLPQPMPLFVQKLQDRV